ncbi:hypothetical protein BC940DRAFT_290764 [Gongronella butleri]|nr:hypothetical protein BC940DRAFT_290764 [Gongronella butleri]
MSPNTQAVEDVVEQTGPVRHLVDHFWTIDGQQVNVLAGYYDDVYSDMNELHDMYLERAKLEQAHGEQLDALAARFASKLSGKAKLLKAEEDKAAQRVGVTGALDAVYTELQKAAQSHRDMSKRLSGTVATDLKEWIDQQQEDVKLMMSEIQDVYTALTKKIHELYKVREKYQTLDRKDPERPVLQNEYRLLLNAIDGLAKQVNHDWRQACAQWEVMEQQRLEFFTTNAWDYANLASARLMVQDEWCEAIRTRLELCTFEQELDLCIEQLGHEASEEPSTSAYVSAYFEQQAEQQEASGQKAQERHVNKEEARQSNTEARQSNTEARQSNTEARQSDTKTRQNEMRAHKDTESKAKKDASTDEKAPQASSKGSKWSGPQEDEKDTKDETPKKKLPPSPPMKATHSIKRKPVLSDFTNKEASPASSSSPRTPDTPLSKQLPSFGTTTSMSMSRSTTSSSASAATTRSTTTSPGMSAPMALEELLKRFETSKAERQQQEDERHRERQDQQERERKERRERDERERKERREREERERKERREREEDERKKKEEKQAKEERERKEQQQQLENQKKATQIEPMPSSMPPTTSMAPKSPRPAAQQIPMNGQPNYSNMPPPINTNLGSVSPLVSPHYASSPMMPHSPLMQPQQHQPTQLYSPQPSPVMLPASSPATHHAHLNHHHQQQQQHHPPSRSPSPFLTQPHQYAAYSRPTSPIGPPLSPNIAPVSPQIHPQQQGRPTHAPDHAPILFWCRSVGDYDANTSENELPFRADTEFAVVRAPQDGWWCAFKYDRGYFVGPSGFIPCNYMAPL